MRILGNGNVGIGTTTPSYALHVNNGSGNADIVVQGNSANGDTGIRILGDRNWKIGSNLGGVGTGKFTIWDLTVGASRLVIDTSGNVGIGTTTPSQTLEVAGSLKASSIVFPDSTTQTTAMRTADLIRNITFLAGCDWCGLLDDSYSQKTIYYNLVGPMTITGVACFSDAGTPIINVGKNGTGSGILSSNLTCSTSGSFTTSFSDNVLNTYQSLDFKMITAGGTAKRVTVTIQVEIN